MKTAALFQKVLDTETIGGIELHFQFCLINALQRILIQIKQDLQKDCPKKMYLLVMCPEQL